MTILATARATSSATPDAFFERWADMATWPEWNNDTEWVRLDGTFTQGATGRLKPKGGPSVAFVVERLVPGREFVDVSRLFGARLTFDHQVSVTADGRTLVEVTASLTGPLRALWNVILGKGIAASLQTDADALARAAETASKVV
jgi:hypothetical protein